jgi:uncharacterized protein YtpQ (UPF0354 family)
MRSRPWYAPVLALFGISRSAKAEEKLTQASFTERYAAALRTALPRVSVAIAGDLLVVTRQPDGEDFHGYLDNAWTAASLDPAEVDDVISRYVASAKECATSDALAPDRDRIVPVVKDRAWHDEVHAALRERGQTSGIADVWEEYNAELIIAYAQDTASNIRYLTPEDLAALGIDRSELRALAVKNLLELLPEVSMRGENGVYMFTAGGDYEASLILADTIWEGGQVKVNGDVVVAIPSRDLLLVCGSGDPSGVARVREMAAKFAAEAPYRLTSDLFVRTNGTFERFVPEH